MNFNRRNDEAHTITLLVVRTALSTGRHHVTSPLQKHTCVCCAWRSSCLSQQYCRIGTALYGERNVGIQQAVGCRVGWWNLYQLPVSYWPHKYTLFRLPQDIISSKAKDFNRNRSSSGVLYRNLKNQGELLLSSRSLKCYKTFITIKL